MIQKKFCIFFFFHSWGALLFILQMRKTNYFVLKKNKTRYIKEITGLGKKTWIQISPNIIHLNLGHKATWAEQSHWKGILDFIFAMKQRWITDTLSTPSANRPWRLSLGTPRPCVLETVHAWFRSFSWFQKKYFCGLPISLHSEMNVILYSRRLLANENCRSWSRSVILPSRESD